jgi:hypothetical protein
MWDPPSSLDLPCVQKQAEIRALVSVEVRRGRRRLGLEDEQGVPHPRAEEPVVRVPVDLHLELVDGDALVAPELPLQVPDENVNGAVDLDHHVDVYAAAEVAGAALDADVVQLALLVEPGLGEEPLLAEDVLLLAHQDGVLQRRPRPGPPERLLLEVAEEEDDLLARDHRDVVVGQRLGLIGVPRAPEVPHDVDRLAVDLELLGAILAPEVPRLHLHLAGAAAALAAAIRAAGLAPLPAAALVLAAARRPFDRHGQAVGEQVPAPRYRDQAVVAGDARAVDQRHRALPRPGRRRGRRDVRELLAGRETRRDREQVLHHVSTLLAFCGSERNPIFLSDQRYPDIDRVTDELIEKEASLAIHRRLEVPCKDVELGEGMRRP